MSLYGAKKNVTARRKEEHENEYRRNGRRMIRKESDE
jgi:hypothetical protein